AVGYRSNLAEAERTPLEEVGRILSGAQLYRLDPRCMAMPASFHPKRKFRLDTDGFGLPTLLDDLLGFTREIFLRVRALLCPYFPQFKSFRVETEDAVR